MGKLLPGTSALSLLFLAIGTDKMPQDALFWLASGTLKYQIVRCLLIVLLLMQVFTRPPRRIQLRLITGTIAVVIAAWTLQATIAFGMPALDTLAFLAACIALMVIALEREFTLTSPYSLTGRKMVSR